MLRDIIITLNYFIESVNIFDNEKQKLKSNSR